MSDFSFLKPYVLSSEQSIKDEKLKHHLYPLSLKDISDVHSIFEIPEELYKFYIQIGYGFFHHIEQYALNRLMPSDNFKQINLKEDYYEFDPDLDIYDALYKGEKLIFFEITEGNYLAIDKKAVNGKNAIYYFEDRIANSLEEFLIEYDKNPKIID